LHDYTVSFLASQGIRDEPVVWEPPISLVSGLVALRSWGCSGGRRVAAWV